MSKKMLAKLYSMPLVDLINITRNCYHITNKEGCFLFAGEEYGADAVDTMLAVCEDRIGKLETETARLRKWYDALRGITGDEEAKDE